MYFTWLRLNFSDSKKAKYLQSKPFDFRQKLFASIEVEAPSPSLPEKLFPNHLSTKARKNCSFLFWHQKLKIME